jgi:hypothetical protein
VTYCPKCSKDIHPLEDEIVLALLNGMAEDIKLRPEEADRITDKTCVAITAYIRGRERKYWEVRG